MTFPPAEWTAEDLESYRQRNARIEALTLERLAEYRRSNVRVIDMFIDPDDDSSGEPNLWMACDHDTGDLIRRLSSHELDAFYAEHPNWVEYTALLYELQELVDDDR